VRQVSQQSGEGTTWQDERLNLQVCRQESDKPLFPLFSLTRQLAQALKAVLDQTNSRK
jgi:hypothetical protein